MLVGRHGGQISEMLRDLTPALVEIGIAGNEAKLSLALMNLIKDSRY